MLDIVSPQHPSRHKPHRAQPKRRRFIKQKPQAVEEQIIHVGPKVVTLDWRLPARLRRPIREELRKERQKRATRQSIVKFKKHHIYKHEPEQSGANIGAEHHTGDVYMHARPGVQVTVPPYMGSFVRRQETPTTRRKPNRVIADNKLPLTTKPSNRKSRRVDSMPVRSALPMYAGERDVPFSWDKYKGSPNEAIESTATLSISDTGVTAEPVIPPKRRFALPLHFSIFPLNLWPKKSSQSTSKKKLHDDTLLTRQS